MPISARFEGQSPDRGHRIRDGALRERRPDRERKVPILIVGAGAAGLSAARSLHLAGVDDFVVLDLEAHLGGTARAGASNISAFPMGAHYLPAPHRECAELETFLEEIGLMTGRDAQGQAQYLPSAICAAPTERHYYRGLWYPGLYPAAGQSQAEADDWARWQAHLHELDDRCDASGQRLFRLPLRRSSSALRHLDAVDMRSYVEQLGITSWRTHWVIDYACRDDYGTRASGTSAFAGLHHFLARGLESRRDAFILTAPGGNAELIEGLRAGAGIETSGDEKLALDELVFDVDPERGEVRSWNATGSDQITRWNCDRIVWAAPRFVLSRVLRHDPHASSVAHTRYAPWLVANLALREAPRGPGAPLAWDNVAIESDDLGYVVATHGSRTASPPGAPAQISFYQALTQSGDELREARAQLLAGDASFWGEQVLKRLEFMHGDIRKQVTELQIHRWGHAMVRPAPGSLFGVHAEARAAVVGRVYPCSTDTQGIALFEEAFYAGQAAASWALAALA